MHTIRRAGKFPPFPRWMLFFAVLAVLVLGACKEDSKKTATVPDAPTGVTATPGDGQVTISWDPVTTADSYNIYWSTTAGISKDGSTQIEDATSPYDHDGLTNGTVYYFAVTAVEGKEESDESEEVSALPGLIAPDSVTVTSSTTDRVELSWSFTPVGTSAEWGIAIARRVESTGIWMFIGSVAQDQESYQDTGLTTDTEYFYKLFAYQDYDPTAISEDTLEESVTTPTASAAPTAASNMTAAAVDGWMVDLAWEDNATDEDGYVVERSLDDTTYTQIASLGPDVVTLRDSNVAADTLYYYRVRAFNDAGISSNQGTSLTTPSITPTDLSGGIDSDLTLSLEDSPFLVSADVAVAPGFTLTIEAGVHVRFADDVGMEIRGQLQAVGTAAAPIVFTAADPSTAAQGTWNRIYVNGDLGGTATFRHAQVSFATTGILAGCCGGSVEVYDSVFDNNTTAIEVEEDTSDTSDTTDTMEETEVANLIYRSRFTDNGSAVTGGGEKVVVYSNFADNGYGVSGPAQVSFSTFDGHTTAALNGQLQTVQYCTITNNAIGVSADEAGISVSYSHITGNATGILLENQDASKPAINNNNIYDNTTYNLHNNDPRNQDATGNWWGTTDTDEIEPLVQDFYDDVSLGIVDYASYLENPVDVFP